MLVDCEAHLHFHRDHAGFQIQERAAGTGREGYDTLDVPEAWRHEGPLAIREPAEDWAPTLVRLERDGTEITLSSNDLRAGELADLAGRLTQVSPEPPRYGA